MFGKKPNRSRRQNRRPRVNINQNLNQPVSRTYSIIQLVIFWFMICSMFGFFNIFKSDPLYTFEKS